VTAQNTSEEKDHTMTNIENFGRINASGVSEELD
jgi:hypothetical protein